jgi:hypothetical protein
MTMLRIDPYRRPEHAYINRVARRQRNRLDHLCRRLHDELDRLGAPDEVVHAFHEALALWRERELIPSQ